jgi:hypothetical protein
MRVRVEREAVRVHMCACGEGGSVCAYVRVWRGRQCVCMRARVEREAVCVRGGGGRGAGGGYGDTHAHLLTQDAGQGGRGAVHQGCEGRQGARVEAGVQGTPQGVPVLPTRRQYAVCLSDLESGSGSIHELGGVTVGTMGRKAWLVRNVTT